MKCINNMHLKSHNLTIIEFKKRFSNYETQSEEVKLKNIENRKLAVKARIIAVKEISKKNLEKQIENFLLLKKCCKQCGKLLSYKKEPGEFCNKSCSAKYNNLNRSVVFTKEGKARQRENGFQCLKNFDAFQKVRPKAEIFNKVCEICNKSFQVTCEQKLNKTCSKECRCILYSKTAHRENNTYGKSGYYQGVYCASSWELAFLIYNKDLGKDIKRCDLTFNYVMKDIEHTYFPDFIIDNIVCEVKGRELEDVQFKTEAVIKSGYKIELIRKKEILPIIKQIKTKYNVKDIIDLYD